MNNIKFTFWFPKRSVFVITVSAILILLALQTGKAQTYVYDAFIRNHKVGQMTVVREVNDESEKISVQTHIEAHMLVKIRVDFESHSSYMNGELKEAEAISKTNGRIHSKATTYRNGNEYMMTLNSDKPVSLGNSPLYGGDLFYFEEPAAMKKVYSLATGEVLNVENDGNGTYYFVNDGKKELHQYKNGELQEMRIEHRLYTVVFKRVP